jgi:aconitate hydratase
LGERQGHHSRNANFGVLSLTFAHPADYDRIKTGVTLRMTGIAQSLKAGQNIQGQFDGLSAPITLCHNLSARQIDVLAVGGAINWQRNQSSIDETKPPKE